MQILIAVDNAKAIKARIEGPSRRQVTAARRYHAELVARADAGYAKAAAATDEDVICAAEEAAWIASEMAYDLACEFRAAGYELEGC